MFAGTVILVPLSTVPNEHDTLIAFLLPLHITRVTRTQVVNKFTLPDNCG